MFEDIKKGLYWRRIKCNKCGLEQTIALSDKLISEGKFKSVKDIDCRQCGSIDKVEIADTGRKGNVI